jgi:hypothetical protein
MTSAVMAEMPDELAHSMAFSMNCSIVLPPFKKTKINSPDPRSKKISEIPDLRNKARIPPSNARFCISRFHE